MLRRALILYGLLCLALAVALLAAHAVVWVAADLLINGAIVVAALLVERRRYQPQIDSVAGRWQVTGERFVDPADGHLIEVHYNPDTGQRAYVDTSSDDEPPNARSSFP